MAKLIYSAITSLDGYVADEQGNFDWAEPDEEVHRFVNELERPVGTYLYGRRMYETMVFWETAHTLADQPPFSPGLREDLAGRGQDRLLKDAGHRLQRKDADRARVRPGAVRQLKAAAERDITVGGPHLAAQAIEAGLVDEFHLFLTPIVVGGGKQALPDDVRVELELLDERRFGNGVIYLRYRVRA